MPNVESQLDTAGGVRYITVCNVQNVYHQIPVAASKQDKTGFVTQNGKWVFKRLPFGIAKAPFLFSQVMSLAFAHFGSLCLYERLVTAVSYYTSPSPRDQRGSRMPSSA